MECTDGIAEGQDGQPDSLVPARILNEWTYCPRLAILEWAHGEWRDNADTVQGQRVHVASDTGRAPALQPPDEIDERGSGRTTRRLLLGSVSLGLTAKIDVLESGEGKVTPVEIKKGSRPHVEWGARLPERVQICVQALLLREAGYRCDAGAIWFAGSRERVTIELSEELVKLTRDSAAALLEAVRTDSLPPPLRDSHKCTRCALRPVCLPDEINWFDEGGIAPTPPPPSRPALPLYVQAPGARVGKSGEVLRIWLESELVSEVPLDEVSEVVLAGPVGLTTPAMHELLRRDIPVAWMSGGFWMLGSTGGQGPRSATVRVAQYRAAADETRRLRFATSLISAKVRNQRTLLRRGWRGSADARALVLDKLTRLIKRIECASDEDVLRGFEGEAAALYFRAMPRLFTTAVSEMPEFVFERRNRRPPADPVNACLSFSYALLTRTWTSALSIVGLDPWKGLWHVERPGRPALALDMIEPYRSILADSTVLTALNNGEVSGRDFIHTAGGCNLSDNGRKSLIAVYERRLDQEVTHPVFGYRVSMRRMLHVQARLLARYLMDEIPSYPHYTPR